MLGGQHAEGYLVRDHEGTDIQGGARLAGHPVLVRMDDGLDGGEEQVVVHLGHTHALAGVGHALGVHVRPEDLDAAVRPLVGLHALKEHLGIVEHCGSRVQGDGAIGDHLAIVPALAFVVAHFKHVVGKVVGKAQLILGGLGLGMLRADNGEGIFCHIRLLSTGII